MDLNTPYVSLRTFRKSNEPVDTPVWFAATNAKTLYVFSAGNAGKVKRIRNSPESEISPCDWKGNGTDSWTKCKAYLVSNEQEQLIAYQALNNKYDWQMKILDFFSGISGKIKQRAVIQLKLD